MDLTDGTNVRVQLASHVPGQPWSAATNLSDAGADASAPNLSLSSTGYGAIAWTRSDGANTRIAGLAPRAGRRIRARRHDLGCRGRRELPGRRGGRRRATSSRLDGPGDQRPHARRYTAATGTWGTIDRPRRRRPIPRTRSCRRRRSRSARPASPRSPGPSTPTRRTRQARAFAQVQTRTQDTGGTWTPMVQHSTTANPCRPGPAARRRRRRERDARVVRVPVHVRVLLLLVYAAGSSARRRVRRSAASGRARRRSPTRS